MKITVNGDAREMPSGSTLRDLLQTLDLRREALVAEVNRNIVEKTQDSTLGLQEGDQVELIQFVGGG
jgi:sulfur carrier protein